MAACMKVKQPFLFDDLDIYTKVVIHSLLFIPQCKFMKVSRRQKIA